MVRSEKDGHARWSWAIATVENLIFGFPIFRKERKKDLARLDQTLACLASFGSVPPYKLELRPGSNPRPAYINKAARTVQRSLGSW